MSEQRQWLEEPDGKPLGRWHFAGCRGCGWMTPAALPHDGLLAGRRWPDYVDAYEAGMDLVTLLLPDGQRQQWTMRLLVTLYTPTPSDEPVAYPGGAPFVRGSLTSQQAAESQREGSAAARRQVLHAIIDRGVRGATDDELEQELGMLHQTCSARRRELVLERLVVGTERKRVTRTGRRATVWVATPEARQMKLL